MKNSRQNRPEGPKTPDYVRIQLVMAAVSVAIVFVMTVIAGSAASAAAQGGMVL